ncbi:hypothetical protein Rsub_10046 [Raphidocelis subcapitata]|uniref:Uncharacterized protein n=1 Tax=Raphidocelis subcapitata TaxID=307507 RepID=A0A2V0PJG2_9CHLO|nr:hypothetical protein Rsub_10046 [Raphidocelis subcapitata]|eukprot:GBF97185.1 hypothetical protein Rsub_10046 [Raphidocelis subcapitata]
MVSALLASGTPDLGSQRVVLAFAEQLPGATYGQAARVTLQLPGGGSYTCICAVSARSRQAALAPNDADEAAAGGAAAAAAVDPAVECPARGAEDSGSAEERTRQPGGPPAPSAFEAALAALRAPAPLPASLRPCGPPPVAARRAVAVVPEALRSSPWVRESLQQRLVEAGCRVHLSAGSSCLVPRLEPPAPAGVVYRIVRSTAIDLATADEAARTEAAEAAAAAAAPSAGRGGGGGARGGASRQAAGAGGRAGGGAAGGARGARPAAPAPAALRQQQAPAAGAPARPGSGRGPTGRGGRGGAGGVGAAGRQRAAPQQRRGRGAASDSDSSGSGSGSGAGSPIAAAASAFDLLSALGGDD